MGKKKSTKQTTDAKEYNFEIPAKPKVEEPVEEVAVSSEASSTEGAAEDVAKKIAIKLQEEEDTNFKYLTVKIYEMAKNEYKVIIVNQSHGFCNFLCSKLLNITGVQYAAYKFTSLESPALDIKLDGSKDIKKILKEVTDKMRDDVKVLSKLISEVTF
jgi:DNA-directed RNA polymerase subunit L